MTKYLIIALLGGGLLLFTHWKAYSIGIDVQKGIEAQARQDLIDKEQEAVKHVKKEDNKQEKKANERIKTIYKMADPTGCLDRTLDSIGLLRSPSEN